MRQMRLVPPIAAIFAAIMLVPSAALAASHPSPSGRHTLGISVSENPIVEGQPIVIYGHLNGPNAGGRNVTLYHRTAYASGYTAVQSTTTDPTGYYAFDRLPERVLTNRDWYVRSLGARSATVHEHVYAQVTIAGSLPAGSVVQTGPHNPVTFTGVVTPASGGQEIVLQRQDADGGEQWHTIQQARVRPGGTYSITHEFRFPGDANIRVLLRRDGVNIASPSEILSYEIEQAENPALTIEPSQNPIVIGQSETISGAVAGGNDTPVTLYARSRGGAFAPIASGTTDQSGNYSFPVGAPQSSTFYQVHSSSQESTVLFVGVKYAVTATATATTIAQGQDVTLTGSVTPSSPDHVVNLQEKAASGQWVTIQRTLTAGDSTFTLTRPLFVAGTISLRAFVPGGPTDQGAASAVVTVNVTAVEASQLPQNPTSDEPATGVAG